LASETFDRASLEKSNKIKIKNYFVEFLGR